MTKQSKPAKPQALPKRIGRPSSFTEETADAICEQIALGKSLRTICKADGMPGISTVIRWLADEENAAFASFRARYARAMDLRTEMWGEEIIDIVDDQSLDPNARRVMVDSRKWLMGKQKPKKYGDRLDQTIEHVQNDVAERLVAGRQRVLEMRKQA